MLSSHRIDVSNVNPGLALPLVLLALLHNLGAPAYALEIDQLPELKTFIQEISAKHGMTIDSLNDLFERVEFKPDIIEAMERPKESSPWYEYRKQFVTQEQAHAGLKYWKANAAALFRAGAEYGVAPEVIVAIIGVETRYGRNTGHYRVVDALSTLAFKYPVRAEYFRRELEEYLLLMVELDTPPLTFKGSYAGAMGIPQFMPSSYRSYAVDFDGDHKINLLSSADDAIGSVANYLKRHGWKKDELICQEVQVDNSRYTWPDSELIEPNLSVKQLKKYGVIPVQNIDIKQLAMLVTLEGEDGPIHRLGYNNFYVITRYNRSKLYAMAVYELSQILHKLYYEGES